MCRTFFLIPEKRQRAKKEYKFFHNFSYSILTIIQVNKKTIALIKIYKHIVCLLIGYDINVLKNISSIKAFDFYLFHYVIIT